MSVKRYQFDTDEQFQEAQREEMNQLVMYMHNLIVRAENKASRNWKVAMLATLGWGLTYLWLVAEVF
tara:strand:+ start:2880 stop:3080 length:201 start_codon:yes stop_codon:yes gene_type:complete